MEMIQINTKSTLIPVRIGELQFSFDMSDESIIAIDSKYKELQLKWSELKEDENSTKLMLEEGFSLFLGDGAFGKVYEQTPSTAICVEYLYNVIEALYEEMSKKVSIITQNDLSNEYLNKKNIK